MQPMGMDPLLGRESLVARLDQALTAGADGAGTFVLLSGEPGIGKTRLARECARRAAERGFTVAWSVCDEDGGTAGFWPWAQLVSALVAARPELADRLGAAHRLTEPGQPPADPELARHALFEAVVTVLRTASRSHPLLLVIDDAHWADEPSLSLLGHVAAHLPTLPVVLVATSRSADATGSRSRQLDRLAATGHLVDLEGLPAADLAQLVARVTGEPPAPTALTELVRRTGGNPLFAMELARLARAQRLALDRVPLPATVRALIMRRLGPQSDQARELLDTAAVLGTRFRLEPLARLTGIGSDAVLAGLTELTSGWLIRQIDPGWYEFAHPLFREAVSDELGLARRVRLHERAAETLQELAAAGARVDPAEIAHHFTCAAPAGRAADAIRHLLVAGEAATRMLAYEQATLHYATALGLLDAAPQVANRADLLVALGQAHIATGDSEQARQAHLAAADAARTGSDPERLAAAALGLGGGTVGFEVTLFDREQVALLEEALAHVPADSPTRPLIMARLSVALSLSAPVARRTELSRQALALAADRGNPAVRAYALAAHCDAIAGPADAVARREAAAEIVDLAAGRGDARMELLGRRLAVVALLELGDLPGADAQISAYARLARDVRQPQFDWYVPVWRAMQALAAGQIGLADRWLARAEELQPASSLNAGMLIDVVRWWRQVETAQWQEQLATIERQVETIVADDTAVQVGLAAAESFAGRLAGAGQRLARVGEAGLARVPVDSEWLDVLAQAAMTAGLVGDRQLAGWIHTALRPHRHRFAVAGIGAYCHGSVLRFLGIAAATLGRHDEARAHFEAAVVANESAGLLLPAAATCRDAAMMLVDPDWRRRAIDAYRALSIESQAADLSRRLAAIGTQPAKATPVSDTATRPAAAECVREGEYWRLSWAGRTVRVKDSKGLHDLVRLLQEPGREVPALDLIAAPGAVTGGDLGEVVDAPARAAYRARLAELSQEIDEADQAGDAERSARAVAERDALVEQLSGAYGLGGRPRRAGEAAERARSAISWRLRDAIRRISGAHPELGRHLRLAIRTGRYVAYDPEQPVRWTTAG